jgi:hypothetical protein
MENLTLVLCRGVLELFKERKSDLEEKKTKRRFASWYTWLHIFNKRRRGDISQTAVVDYKRTMRVKTRGGQEPVFTKEGVC